MPARVRTLSLAQLVFTACLSVSTEGQIGRILSSILFVLRRILVRMGDPLVAFKISKINLMIPLSHDLPFYRKVFPQYGSNVARIAQAIYSKYPRMTLIDIGANIGDTVALVRDRAQFPILCLEGNNKYFQVLHDNLSELGGDVIIERVYIAASSGMLGGRIESQFGTSHIVTDSITGGSIRTLTLSEILSSKPTFASPKMIKIDTDGFDCMIIEGEVSLLERTRPVLFFEYDPSSFSRLNHDGFQVFSVLEAAGYTTVMVYENTGDYLLTTEIHNKALLEDIHKFYSGRGGLRYCDICAFHEDDADLCEKARRSEIAFFQNFRKG